VEENVKVEPEIILRMFIDDVVEMQKAKAWALRGRS